MHKHVLAQRTRLGPHALLPCVGDFGAQVQAVDAGVVGFQVGPEHAQPVGQLFQAGRNHAWRCEGSVAKSRSSHNLQCCFRHQRIDVQQMSDLRSFYACAPSFVLATVLVAGCQSVAKGVMVPELMIEHHTDQNPGPL